MASDIEKNSERIKTAQERILNISLEDLAENLYNASLSNYMWRGKDDSPCKNYPFYIDHRGTHADYEIIIPNIHEVYNISDENIKKKMVDSVSWPIDNSGKEIRGNWDYEKDKQEWDKIQPRHIGNYLLNSFSGNESYPLDLHEFEKRPFLLKEDSLDMREYIKNKFRNSLLSMLENSNISEDIRREFYIVSRPMEILPLEKWKKGIQDGYGMSILINKKGDSSTFFGEEKYNLGINEVISLGFSPEQMADFYKNRKEVYLGPLHFKKFLDLFKDIKDKSIKKSFINVLDNAISMQKVFIRKGNNIVERKR